MPIRVDSCSVFPGSRRIVAVPIDARGVRYDPAAVKMLGIDVGSSAVKAAVLQGTATRGKIVRATFATDRRDFRVEVPAERVLNAVREAVKALGPAAQRVNVIALSVMSPAWCAMDSRGRALTPLITHQDRRSIAIAEEIERRIGKARHLRIAGNRPFPGGISSTTWAWYLKHEPGRIAKADLVGQLNTFLIRQLTAERVIDPSNASFMGTYATTKQKGWSDELCEAIGAKRSLLPEVIEANVIAGHVTRSAAETFGLTAGTPVLTGLVDTSAAMLLTGAKPGRMLNVCGSTDVLALSTDTPHPHEKLLTRALGVGAKWMSVSTLAASGAALDWARATMFRDLPRTRFASLIKRLSQQGGAGLDDLSFDPFLAGERTSIEQRRATFHGLTLATTREQMLQAIIHALAQASAARLELFKTTGVRILPRVVLSGGASNHMGHVFQRDWPGRRTFQLENEASLRGLGKLVPSER